MNLLPAIVTVVILGLTPLGGWLATGLNGVTGWGTGPCLAALYLLSYGVGVGILRLVVQLYPNPTAEENDWFRFGDTRGQEWLSSMLSITVVLGVMAVVFQPSTAWGAGCMLAVTFVGVSSPWPIRKTLWPPEAKPFMPAPLHQEADLLRTLRPAPGEAVVKKSFRWDYITKSGSPGKGHFSMDVTLRQSEIDRFGKRDHSVPEQYDATEMRKFLPPYVIGGTTAEVEYVAAQLARQAQSLQLRYLDFVNFVVAFVNDTVRYTSDENQYGAREYWAYPMETLANERGDCEDSAILLAALLRALGVDVILIHVREPSHVAVGIALTIERPGRWVNCNGKQYFYAEAIEGQNWRIGQLPSNIDTRPENFVPIPLT